MPEDFKEVTEIYNQLSDKYDKQVERIHTAYKWLGSLITIIIVAGGLFFYSNTSDINKEYKDVIDRMEKNLNKEVEFSKGEMQQKVNNMFEVIKTDISDKINREFSSDKISDLVEAKARERIDKVADQLIVDAIQSQINPRIQSSERKLTSLIEDTESKIGVLEFNLYRTMALNDSRIAFDQIYSWSLQTEYKLNKEAKEAVKEIIKEYKDPVLHRTGGYILVSSDEPEKLSFDKILTEFSDASREEKVNLLEMLWKNSDISKNEKGKFLLKVIKNDASLKVVTTATKKLIQLYDLKFNYLDLTDIISWGTENIK